MMLATVSQLGGRLPKQVKRAIPPLCLAWIFITLFLSNARTFDPSPEAANVLKRDLPSQTTLGAAATEFPRKIWQSWKIDPLGFEERDSACARTWTSKNPGHRYEVLTDNNDMFYVEEHFGPSGLNRPDIVSTYRSLTAKIIKADFLRYLVMYVEGGVYADIDVEALKPIDRFIPERHSPRDVDMVIGVEIDQPDFKDHPILGKKSMSFCQWTFMCKPGLPVMMRLIENIIAWLNDVALAQQKSISDIVLDFDEVISGTGPSAFTSAVLADMSARTGQFVDWSQFHNLGESKLVGGVLVLNVEAFAAGQGHSDSGNHNARGALVKHRYHASKWPAMHPRYSHPVLGEVEACNWDPECVKIWDYNKALFDSLPPDEQNKQIADKLAADGVLSGARLEARDFNATEPESATQTVQASVMPSIQPSVMPSYLPLPSVEASATPSVLPPSSVRSIPGFTQTTYIAPQYTSGAATSRISFLSLTLSLLAVTIFRCF